MRIWAALIAIAWIPFGTNSAAAQYSEPYGALRASPENFALELRIGTYDPDFGTSNAFDLVFGGDNGPFVGGELDYFFYRIPFVGLIGVGINGGWVGYKAKSCEDITCSDRTDENTRLRLFPLSTMAVLRIDVLARKLNVPIVVSGKIGLDTVFFRARTGSTTEARGRSIGLRWGVQFALELDFIEPRSARTLDTTYGINHAYAFGEIFGSQADSDLPLGLDLGWVAGLGLTF